MTKKICLKKLIYIFLFILLIFYGFSLAIYIILYFIDFKEYNSDNNKNDNKLIFIGKRFIITNIIVKSIIFVSTTLFACYFNCFLSQGILVFYITSLIIMIIFELPSFFILLENLLQQLYNLHQYDEKILFIFIFNASDIISGFTSILTSLALRNVIIEEIELSPLNYIDLDMTEKKYNNIFQKSTKHSKKVQKGTNIENG